MLKTQKWIKSCAVCLCSLLLSFLWGIGSPTLSTSWQHLPSKGSSTCIKRTTRKPLNGSPLPYGCLRGWTSRHLWYHSVWAVVLFVLPQKDLHWSMASQPITGQVNTNQRKCNLPLNSLSRSQKHPLSEMVCLQRIFSMPLACIRCISNTLQWEGIVYFQLVQALTEKLLFCYQVSEKADWHTYSIVLSLNLYSKYITLPWNIYFKVSLFFLILARSWIYCVRTLRWDKRHFFNSGRSIVFKDVSVP